MNSAFTDAVRRVLAQNPKKTLTDPSLVPAAVLLLVYPKDGDYCILLNKRTDRVEHHKGEISFPGGRREGSDRTLLDTALRETHEEMGVMPGDVEVLGELDDVATPFNVVSPFVGTIAPSYRFKPSAREVAEVLEVPVASLGDEDNHRDEVRLVDGEISRRESYVYRGHLIFGATAKVLTRFLNVLDTARDGEAPWKTK